MTTARRNGKSWAAMNERAVRVLAATTHYEVLAVSIGATNEAIKDAHRALARVFHPDRCPLPNAHDVMSRVNQAYACLTDKAARKLYDTVNKTNASKCGACEGTGRKFKQQGFGRKVFGDCPTCGGSGKC